MLQDFSKKKVLPVFLTFRKASLLKTSNPEQFQNWMLSRICSEVLRVLKKTGKLSPISGGLSLLAGEESIESSKIDDIAKAFENSWKTPGELIDVTKIPTLDDFLHTVEDLCVNWTSHVSFCLLMKQRMYFCRSNKESSLHYLGI